MKEYLRIVKEVLDHGEREHNRTGVDTLVVTGERFVHYMSEGFPLLTTKKMGMKNIATELEFFIKGYHDKQWLKEHKCHIWDEWCSPHIVPYGNDEETLKKMADENELGPIYGVQWRHFGCFNFYDKNGRMVITKDGGVDQLKKIIEEIKTNPNSRRLVCSAWNPVAIPEMALPPCHVLWQIIVYPESRKMDLVWYQRSVDVALGLPYNIASYALLLDLIAWDTGYMPNKLVGMFGSTHIYENHIEGLKEQLKRPCLMLPNLAINPVTYKGIENFDASRDFSVMNYISAEKIKFDVAV